MTRAIAVALLVLGLVGFTLAALDNEADAASWRAFYVEIEGPIMPLTERFLSRAINEAAESGAELLVVELDTPGGLLKTTESMVDTILDAPLPVVVFVSPPGSRAASAGTFITAAGHIAAMSPSTNIGAASPVGGGGQRLLPENRTSAFRSIELLIGQNCGAPGQESGRACSDRGRCGVLLGARGGRRRSRGSRRTRCRGPHHEDRRMERPSEWPRENAEHRRSLSLQDQENLSRTLPRLHFRSQHRFHAHGGGIPRLVAGVRRARRTCLCAWYHGE